MVGNEGQPLSATVCFDRGQWRLYSVHITLCRVVLQSTINQLGINAFFFSHKMESP
jgi:hypothetical protein